MFFLIFFEIIEETSYYFLNLIICQEASYVFYAYLQCSFKSCYVNRVSVTPKFGSFSTVKKSVSQIVVTDIYEHH